VVKAGLCPVPIWASEPETLRAVWSEPSGHHWGMWISVICARGSRTRTNILFMQLRGLLGRPKPFREIVVRPRPTATSPSAFAVAALATGVVLTATLIGVSQLGPVVGPSTHDGGRIMAVPQTPGRTSPFFGFGRTPPPPVATTPDTTTPDTTTPDTHSAQHHGRRRYRAVQPGVVALDTRGCWAHGSGSALPGSYGHVSRSARAIDWECGQHRDKGAGPGFVQPARNCGVSSFGLPVGVEDARPAVHIPCRGGDAACAPAHAQHVKACC